MSELQVNHERLGALEDLNNRFFRTWASMHAAEINGAKVLPEHPTQSVNCFKTDTLMPNNDIDLKGIKERIEVMFAFSLEDKTRAPMFLNALNQTYPGDEKNRSYIQYIVEEYIQKGKNIAATMIHADDGLTDVPRLTAMVKHSLISNYDDEYIEQIGEIASPTLKFEEYKGIAVPELLSLVGETLWLPPGWTENVNIVREQAGLSEEDLEELYSYIIRNGGTVLATDLRESRKSHGRVTVISPPASRAIIKKNAQGVVTSLKPKTIQQPAADMVRRYDAEWPVTIFNECYVFGPIVDIPKFKNPKTKAFESMQNVEDAVEINVDQINTIIGRPGVASYSRNTPRGKIYEKHGQHGAMTATIGQTALRS